MIKVYSVLAVWVFCAVMYIVNLIDIVQYALSNAPIAQIDVLTVLKMVGIFVPPLGVIMGFV